MGWFSRDASAALFGGDGGELRSVGEEACVVSESGERDDEGPCGDWAVEMGLTIKLLKEMWM